MNKSMSETPSELDELINKGESLFVLGRINSILSSSKFSRDLKFTYQILKCRALTDLSQHHHAAGILEEIWDDVFRYGTEIHKIDTLYLKAKNIRILGNYKEAFEIIEEAELIIDKIKTKNTVELIRRKVLILLLKALIIRTLHGSAEDEYKLTKQILALCDDNDYSYGKVLTLRQMARFLLNSDNREESLKHIEEAIEISSKNQYKEVLANSYSFLGEYYAFYDPDVGIEYLDKAKQIGKEIGYRSLTEGLHHSYGIAYCHKNDYDKGLDHFEICLSFYKDSGNKVMHVITLHNKAQIYHLRLEYEKALSSLYEALAIAKEIDLERRFRGILNALVEIFILKGELSRAHKFIEENIEFFKNRSDSKVILTRARNNLGRILLNMGDLESALIQFSESLNYWENEAPEDILALRMNLCNVAEVYRMKGEYRIALNHYLKSIQLGLEKGPEAGLDVEYFGIISCYFEMKEMKEAKTYLDQFHDYSKRVNVEIVQVAYQIAQALYLKENKDISSIRDASLQLEDVISRSSLNFQFLIIAILNLCECYIVELRISNKESILKELNLLIERLQEISVSELTYPLLIQSYRFQAQIALLELDISKAQKLFEKAQSLAEEKGIELLALKISNDHDLLLEQLEEWESFSQRLPAIAEIMGLTHIETALEDMIKRKGIIIGDTTVEEEDPCFIVIFSKSGSMLFMEQFKPEINQEILNNISEKITSRKIEDIATGKIERLVHQDLTFLIKQLNSIVFCYAFIGKSFNGMKKLDQFTKLVFESTQIWSKLTASRLEDTTFDSSVRLLLNQFIDNIFQ